MENKKIKFKLVFTVVALVAVVLLVILCVSILSPMIKYNEACTLFQKGNYEKADSLFRDIYFYKDSREYDEKIVFVYDKMVKTNAQGDETTVLYTYDSFGNILKTQRTGYGLTTSAEYSYDVNGDLIKRTYYDANGDPYSYEWEYDGNRNLVKQILTAMSGNVFVTEYEYDSNGNMIKEKASDYVAEYTYDAEGNRISANLTYTDGNVHNTVYTYSKNGRLLCEELTVNGKVDYTYKYNYDEKGLRTKFINICEKGTLTEDYYYDGKGNMIKNVTTHATGQKSVLKYVYDARGNIIKQTQIWPDGSESVTEYTYTGEKVFCKEKNKNRVILPFLD